MLSLQHNHHASCGQVLVQSVGDLLRQSLLKLRAAREDIDGSRQLGKPRHATLMRQVRHVCLAPERKQVVLARAVEGDPADHHRLMRLVLELRLKMPRSTVGQSRKDIPVGSRNPSRRLLQAVTIRVFSDGQKDFADRPLDPRNVDARCPRGPCRLRLTWKRPRPAPARTPVRELLIFSFVIRQAQRS